MAALADRDLAATSVPAAASIRRPPSAATRSWSPGCPSRARVRAADAVVADLDLEVEPRGRRRRSCGDAYLATLASASDTTK